jgi:integrase/recombinase XerD
MNELEEFQKYLINQQFSVHTINEMLRSVKQFVNWMEQENITIEQCRYNDMLAYVRSLQEKNVKPSYINNCIKDTRWYFKYLISTKIISSNPVKEIFIKGTPRSKVLHCLTEQELEKLYADYINLVEYRDQRSRLKDMVMLGLLIFQGLQQTELKILLVTDIDLDKGVIHVPETPKSKERVLNLNAKQMLPIVRYINEHRIEKLFSHSVHNSTSFMFYRMRKQLDIDINCHDVRTSRIMIWVQQENIRKAQYLSGMKYISSLKKYQEQLTDKLREKINLYHPLETL